jgi:hypothetical protein
MRAASPSTWTAQGGSSLLTPDASTAEPAPDGSRPIVWMINGVDTGWDDKASVASSRFTGPTGA